MKNKIWQSFAEAVSDIPDGSTVMTFEWGIAGTPQNLLRALRDSGVKDITLIVHSILTGRVLSHECSEEEIFTSHALIFQLKKLITPWPKARSLMPEYEAAMKKIDVEITGHGTLIARISAGASNIGPFYCPVGVGTTLEEGKEKRVFDGKEYILEKPLRADYTIIRASKADKYGNLVYHGTERGASPIMAMAADVTIVEVDEIVELGELDPDAIVTPGIFVDRIVKIPEGAMGSPSQREMIRRKYYR